MKDVDDGYKSDQSYFNG